jgi:hypothetical protein
MAVFASSTSVCSSEIAHKGPMRFLDVIVVRNFTHPGEELLHGFVVPLFHVREVSDDNTIVGLISKVLDEGSSDCFVVISVNLDDL